MVLCKSPADGKNNVNIKFQFERHFTHTDCLIGRVFVYWSCVQLQDARFYTHFTVSVLNTGVDREIHCHGNAIVNEE